MILATATLLFPPPHARAFDADSLLIQSIGGIQALDSLRSVRYSHTEGRLTLNGQPGRFESYFAPPSSYFLRLRIGPIEMIQAYDGTTAWKIDHNGQVSVVEGYERRGILKQVYFESGSFLVENRIPGDHKYIGRTVRDGLSYHEIAFYPLGSDTVTVLFDEATGRREIMIGREDNIEITTTVSDYRVVGGMLFPFYSKAIAPSIPLVTELIVEEVTVNEPFDISVFQMPGGEVDFSFPSGKSSVAIPFEYRSGHIYIKAKVNGTRSAWFILDSGASANMLHAPTFADQSLPSEGFLPAKGTAGFEEIRLVRIDSLRIGQLMLSNQVNGIMDLTGIGRAELHGDPFGGILGYDFLSRFPILVSYGDSMLTIFNPDMFSLPDGGVEVPFYLLMNVPTVHAEINSIPGDYFVDLGNSFGLILHREFVRQHSLEEDLDDIREIPGEFGGVGGKVKGKTAYAATFALGEIRLKSLRVLLTESSGGFFGSRELAGNIGNLILEGFQVLFDYSKSRIVFYPRQ
jgi:hypothetical protein